MLKAFRLSFVSLSLLGLAACTSSPLPYNIGINDSDIYAIQNALAETALQVQSSWSPDGSKVAILGARPNPKGATLLTLNIYDAQTGKALKTWLNFDFQTSVQANEQLALPLQWAPDSQSLYLLESPQPEASDRFQLLRFALNAAGQLEETEISKRQIYLPEALKNLETTGFGKAHLSPDGKQLALYRYTNELKTNVDLVVLNLEKASHQSWGQLTLPTGLDKRAQTLAWAPDSQSLFSVNSSGPKQFQINRYQSEAPVQKLLNFEKLPYTLSVSPDGQQLALSLAPDHTASYLQSESHLLSADLRTGQSKHHTLPSQLIIPGQLWSSTGQMGLISYKTNDQNYSGEIDLERFNPLDGSKQPLLSSQPILDALKPTFQRQTPPQLSDMELKASTFPSGGISWMRSPLIPAAFAPEGQGMVLFVNHPQLLDLGSITPSGDVFKSYRQLSKLKVLNLAERPFAFIYDPQEQQLRPLQTPLTEALGMYFANAQFSSPEQIILH